MAILKPKVRASYLFCLISIMSIGSIIFALIMQVYFDMQPCSLCVIQRIVIISIAVISVVSVFISPIKIRKLLWLVLMLLAVVGMGFAFKQLWVEWHPQVTSAMCQIPMDNQFNGWPFSHLLSLLFNAKIFCEDANYDLLGIPFSVCALAFFLIIFIFSIFGYRLKH